MKIKAAVIGMGYWGPKFARNLITHPDFELVAVVDLNISRAAEQLGQINGETARIFENTSEMLCETDVDFVLVAVPPEHHFAIALQLIENRKNVLIEKPVTLNQYDREMLIHAAKKNSVRIFADHTYLFTPEFAKISEICESRELGELIFFNSTRINLGIIQSDTTVVEDLAVHDLAILDSLRKTLPVHVTCNGVVVPPSKVASSAFATLTYADGFIAQLTVSWNSPVKVREIQVAGQSGMAIWDDMAGSDKIRIYNSSITLDASTEQMRISYHLGEGRIPSIISSEAIRRELDYLAMILKSTGDTGITGPSHIERVGKTLDALTKSLAKDGEKIYL